MYPLLELGPLRLSSGGLLLLGALLLWNWLWPRAARALGGAELAALADACLLPAILGAAVGARLWYGLFNWEVYGRTPGLFLNLRLSELAWPGALLGGTIATVLWSWRRNSSWPALADAAALSLPLAQTLAALGQLLSGEAFGVPAQVPWALELLGTARHPTQLYAALAALLVYVALQFTRRRAARLNQALHPGSLAAGYLGLSGLAMLLIEALRGDSLLLPGGIRSTQLVGLTCMLLALEWHYRQSRAHDHKLAAAA